MQLLSSCSTVAQCLLNSCSAAVQQWLVVAQQLLRSSWSVAEQFLSSFSALLSSFSAVAQQLSRQLSIFLQNLSLFAQPMRLKIFSVLLKKFFGIFFPSKIFRNFKILFRNPGSGLTQNIHPWKNMPSPCFLTWPIYLSSEAAQKLNSRWRLQNSLMQGTSCQKSFMWNQKSKQT